MKTQTTQSKKMDSNDSASFAASVFLHLLVVFFLVFLTSTKTQKTKEILFETVTLQEFNPHEKNTAIAPQQNRQQKTLKQKKIHNDEQSTLSANRKETLAGVEKPEVAIGESDIESSLHGRAPVTETERYLAEIKDQIARQQAYPAHSRAFHEEGTVKIRLTLNRSGSLVKIEMLEQSPHKRLNDAAMRAATKASPFKPFPDEIKFETWKITLPVKFILAQN